VKTILIIYQFTRWERILNRYLIDYYLKSSTWGKILKITITGRHPQFLKNFADQKVSFKVSPTNVESRDALRIEDYRKKSCILIQQTKIISKHS
jgi:hypothetical protein